MKTQNTKLTFRKNAVLELNDNKLNEINGGTSPTTIVVSFVASVGFSYKVAKDVLED